MADDEHDPLEPLKTVEDLVVGRTNDSLVRLVDLLGEELVARLEQANDLQAMDPAHRAASRELAALALDVERRLLLLSERARNIRWMVEEVDADNPLPPR